MATYNDKILVPNTAKDGLDTIHPETNTGNVYDFKSSKWLNESLDEIRTGLENHEKKIASTTDLGHIKVDGTTISVNPITGIASTKNSSEKSFALDLNAEWITVQGVLSCYKDSDDVVHLYGVIANRNSVSNASIITTLPELYRPKDLNFYSCTFAIQRGISLSLTIKPNGEITAGSGRETTDNIVIDTSFRI